MPKRPESKTILPYGSWPSPVDPVVLANRIRLEEVRWDSDGRTLVWLEGRPDRGVLVCQTDGGAVRELTGEQSVRGGLFYGGGEFDVSNGVVVFAERDGRLYRRDLAPVRAKPVTPAFGKAASPAFSPDGEQLLYVHSVEGQDCLALVASDGGDWPDRLVWGADFYMQPRWHPDGMRIAWIEYDFPTMPWSGTRLMLGTLNTETLRLEERVRLAGGDDIPIFQPEFSPDGRWLSYVAGEGEWERLVLLDLLNGERRTLVEGCELSQPAWLQGLRVYGWSSTSRRIYHLRNEDGFYSLWQADLESGQPTRLDTGPYTWITQISVSPVKGLPVYDPPVSDRVAFIGSAPNLPTQVVVWDGEQVGRPVYDRRDGASLHPVKLSLPEVISPEDLPSARPLHWNSLDGMPVHGLFYPPTNRSFAGEGLPPAIVFVHSGPTTQAYPRFDPERSYFTSRGYAWLEVNYRGSTGYGRTYRQAQDGRWGEVDVQDVVSSAQALASEGLADAKRIAAYGRSAGGFTVLNALIHHPGCFKAGICAAPVVDLFSMVRPPAQDSPKFEMHYADTLVGRLPEAAERFRDRSPLYNADRIRDPVAIFQGGLDDTVSPEQTAKMASALHRSGAPHLYRVYDGEGHSFRSSAVLAAYYREMEEFLQQHVLYGE